MKARGETQICGIQTHGNLIKNTVRKKQKVSRSQCKRQRISKCNSCTVQNSEIEI